MTLTLFHAPQSRSTRAIWLLEELGVPYDLRIVDIARGGGRGGARDPANPHPHGKVPAIEHDGRAVFESSAIFLYLTDAFPQNRLGPEVGDPRRGAYVSWLAYYAGDLEPAWTAKFLGMDIPPGMSAWPSESEAMGLVEKTLSGQPYILGDAFTAVDLLFASTFDFFFKSGAMARTDTLGAYTDRCVARPAYARAQAKDNG